MVATVLKGDYSGVGAREIYHDAIDNGVARSFGEIGKAVFVFLGAEKAEGGTLRVIVKVDSSKPFHTVLASVTRRYRLR